MSFAVSPVLNEHWYTGGFLVSEGNNYISRDVGVLVNAGTVDVLLDAGLVLSPATGTVTATAGGSNHGNGTVTGIGEGADYIVGKYTLIAQSASVYAVTDPFGRSMPVANVGTAYVDNELNFTINAGTTAYAAGDTWTLAAPAQSGTFVATGTATLPATAVLFNRVVVPASGSTKVTVISRNAEVNSAELQWDATILNAGTAEAGLQAAAISQLALAGIIAR